MKDSPIVGVLAGATRDHLLLDALLHITLCDRNPRGRVLCEIKRGGIPLGQSIQETFIVWEQSTRQCSWCMKKLKKRMAEKDVP